MWVVDKKDFVDNEGFVAIINKGVCVLTYGGIRGSLRHSRRGERNCNSYTTSPINSKSEN